MEENSFLLPAISAIFEKSPCEAFNSSTIPSIGSSPPQCNRDDSIPSVKCTELDQQPIAADRKRAGYECELCKTNFPRFSELLKHDNTKHVADGKNSKCDTCERLFVSSHRLTIHKEITHREKTHECATCRKMFVSKKSLNVHERLHSERYKCEICSFVSTSKLYLSQHALKHEGKMLSFVCKICEKSFSYKSSLLRHENLHLTNRGMSFQCSVCRLFCRSRNDLVEHLKTHENSQDKNYSCAICGRQYNRKKTLAAHLKRHGNGNYKCETCERTFITKYELRIHAETHSNYKAFECFHCDERFSFKNTLVRHIKKYFPRISSNVPV